MVINTEVRHPKYNVDGVTVDCEINHPVFGWVPFTASPSDVEVHGRAIYQALVNGQFGPIVGVNNG